MKMEKAKLLLKKSAAVKWAKDEEKVGLFSQPFGFVRCSGW